MSPIENIDNIYRYRHDALTSVSRASERKKKRFQYLHKT